MGQRSRVLPLARRGDDLVVTELADEVLVYDSRSHAAHCLSLAAARVWRRCDGKATFAEAAEELAARGVAEAARIVEQAVEQLEEIGLVETAAPREEILVRSRRRALRQMAVIGGAALALPLIQSIVAPSSAEACSTETAQLRDPCNETTCCTPELSCVRGECCKPAGSPCQNSAECCPPNPTCKKLTPQDPLKTCSHSGGGG